MGYFQTRKDLKLIQNFSQEVVRLWKIETEASKDLFLNKFLPVTEKKEKIKLEAFNLPEYQPTREKISKTIDVVSATATRHGVFPTIKSFPAPDVGGPILPVNLFYSVLHDTSHGGIKRQMVIDIINQTIGACQRDLRIELHRMFNPFYWLKSIFVFIIRIPFSLISLSGFNVEKFEDHFLSKLFKLIEIIIIVYILIKLGLSNEELKQALLKLITK